MSWSSRWTNNNRQLRVTITDSKAKQFFSKLVTQSQSISRSSVAEYVLPVPLGSPENVFGTGNLSMTNQPTTQNFWAAVNGYCAGHESGDYKLAWWETYRQSGSGCQNVNGQGATNDQPNSDDYDPDGYLYTIDLPANATSLKLDVYDGDFNRSGSTMDNTLCTSCTETITTTYKIYNRNATPLDTSDATMNALLATTVPVATNNASYQGQWKNLYTWNNPVAGRYYVRVLTNPETQNSIGSNGFALRAWTGSSYTTCSTISTATNYSASCPQVHAENAMSIYANLTGTTAAFYLAQIDPVHAGKTMRVNLFDAGEGAQSIKILNPQGTAVTFSWTTPCSPQTPPSGGCSGSTSSLDVSNTGCSSGNCPQPYSFVHSTSKYSDRFLTLDIPLPANYSSPAVYGNKWWKVQYTVGSTPTDRTTWSVNIVGDPVHLLQ